MSEITKNQQEPSSLKTGYKLGSLWRIFGMLRPYKLQVAGAVIALLFTAFSTLAIGKGVSILIDQGLNGDNPNALYNSLLLLFGLGLAIATGSFLRYYLMTWLGERVVADLRHDVFLRIIELDVAFFETTRTGELLSRLTTDTTLLQTVIGSSFSLALRNGIVLFGGLFMMFITNVKLTLLAMVVVPVVIAPILYIGRQVRRLSRESQERVADVGAFAEETINAIRTVKAFTQEQANVKSFNLEVEGAFKTALKRAWLRSTLSATVTIAVFAGLGAVIWAGGNEVMAGHTTGGELGAFLFYAVVVAVAAGVVSEVYGEVQRAAGATERLLELINIRPKIVAPKVPLSIRNNQSVDHNNGRIEFQQVTFYYASRLNNAALKNFSLNIEKGETIALVGPSGAGKSTLFQLLLRFYDPNSGHILLNGVDIANVDPAALRAEIALVPQEPFIFGIDAMENIRYGRPNASDCEVIAAAKEAMIDDFINSLPQGYNTYLGEKGIRLSGGQKQRLSIARAILKDPSFLLLDEATSALDAENERLVQEALIHLMHDRTTLVIAHRLSTVLSATRIAVLTDGQLNALGIHDDLRRDNEIYRKFADLQFINQIPDAHEPVNLNSN